MILSVMIQVVLASAEGTQPDWSPSVVHSVNVS